jgi:hypothetical protein
VRFEFLRAVSIKLMDLQDVMQSSFVVDTNVLKHPAASFFRVFFHPGDGSCRFL